mgnify:CR=1 FL=1
MKNKSHILSVLTLVSLLALSSCGESSSLSSSSSQESNDSSSASGFERPQNSYEDGGKGGNADEDVVNQGSIEDVTSLLNDALTKTKYTYETTSTVTGNEAHFVDYYSDYAWYEENDVASKSFGYSQTKEDNYIFKYYLSADSKTVNPSIYEYSGSGDTPSKVKGLYTAATITSLSLLSSTMSTFSATLVSANKYLITDDNTASVFQYMSTYGSSISSYLVGVYIDIIDLDSCQFKVTISLGDYGSIISTFTPVTSTKVDFVSELAKAGTLTGVDSFKDVTDFLNLTKDNNYILHGIKTFKDGQLSTRIPYTINCTNNYFFLDYDEEGYTDYGYVLVPKNTEITYYSTDSSGVTTPITQTLTYDSCYGFDRQKDGSFKFTFFKGPVETETTKYKEVAVLPTTGETGILYIVPNTEGGKDVYEWAEKTDGTYGYSLYSTWYDCVGDFSVNDASASFYLSGTVINSLGGLYFEKDYSKDTTYFSSNSDIVSALSNGLFGWGFQATTTWMDYIEKSYITVNKDSEGNIIRGDVGLELTGTNGDIYYTFDNFNNANLKAVDTFLAPIFGE